MTIAVQPPKKAYKSLPMEGLVAAWYAKSTRPSLPVFEADAERIAARVPKGARILEVAPGPGYLAVALARRGFDVSALDISQAFVRMVSENAAAAGVRVDARLGDAAHAPFDDEAFDFIVCRAAFKNFADPVGALREMRRMLKPGAEALIIDMRRESTDADIDQTVDEMRIGPLNAAVIRAVFKHSLRKRAYSAADFERMAIEAGFGAPETTAQSISLDVRLTR